MRTDALANQTIEPILREARFRKKNRTWNRRRGQFIDVINIQTDTKAGLSDSFTVNIGVFLPDFYEIVWGHKNTSFVSEAHCPVRLRINELIQGDLSGLGYDRWWDLDSEAALEQASLDTSDALRRNVLPFFERFQTIQDIHAFMDNARGGLSKSWDFRLYLAIAKHRVGDAEGAKTILEECRQIGWTEHAERVITTLGI